MAKRRWVPIDTDLTGRAEVYSCPDCGELVRYFYKTRDCLWDYCPHCGKYMGDVEQYSVGAGISQNAIMAKLFLMEDDLK